MALIDVDRVCLFSNPIIISKVCVCVSVRVRMSEKRKKKRRKANAVLVVNADLRLL